MRERRNRRADSSCTGIVSVYVSGWTDTLRHSYTSHHHSIQISGESLGKQPRGGCRFTTPKPGRSSEGCICDRFAQCVVSDNIVPAGSKSMFGVQSRVATKILRRFYVFLWHDRFLLSDVRFVDLPLYNRFFNYPFPSILDSD